MLPDTSPAPGPRSLSDLFLSFTWLALQGFGGVHAVVQREMVDRKRWLTREEFIGETAVAQIMPGANVVNLSLIIGGRYFGAIGAAVALAGLVCVPAVLIGLLTLVYSHFSSHPQVAGALRGIGAVTSGIAFAAGFRLIPALRGNILTPWLCAAALLAIFVCIGVLRWPMIGVLAVVGGVAGLVAWLRLDP